MIFPGVAFVRDTFANMSSSAGTGNNASMSPTYTSSFTCRTIGCVQSLPPTFLAFSQQRLGTRLSLNGGQTRLEESIYIVAVHRFSCIHVVERAVAGVKAALETVGVIVRRKG